MWFQVTYTIPGQASVTQVGLTESGKRSLMNAVILAGGFGVCEPYTQPWDREPASETQPTIEEEAAKVRRVWQRYSHEERANVRDSWRLGIRQREALGQYYYVHPALPDRAYRSRKQAALAALAA